MLRKVLLGLIALAAVVVTFGLQPDGETVLVSAPLERYDSLIETALSDYDANNAMADSAPQQEVVNGWVAKDLLTIQAMIQANGQEFVVQTPNDPRIEILILLGILALVVMGVTPSVVKSTATFQETATDFTRADDLLPV
jgi:hypothetical protein